MAAKGVLLYSGGLDSLLAARLLLDQGVDLLGVMFLLPFHPPDFNPEGIKSVQLARRTGLPLSFFPCGKEYMEMVKNPPHGYGKNMNPCIDCKIFFLRKARGMMEREGASFVATGEVVGQRPMSQMKPMLRHIEKESGLEGYLLRPLSAKLLPPTRAEEEGIVDRERLLDIRGRSRRVQMELAEKFEITDYASPAGGCLFTDENIARRVKDLLAHHGDYTMTDVYLLTVGRHYRLNGRAKIIVSRNERENGELEKYRDAVDYFLIPEFKGPSGSVKGALEEADFGTIASLMARYGRSGEGDTITVFRGSTAVRSLPAGRPVPDEELSHMRI